MDKDQLVPKNSTIKFFSVDNSNSEYDIEIASVEHRYEELKQLETCPENSLEPNEISLEECTGSIDIDAMYGPITFKDFSKAVIHSLEINIKPTYKISTKNAYVVKNNNLTSISTLNHVQVGCITLPVGKANIYYVSPSLPASFNSSVMLNYVKSTFENIKLSVNSVSNVIPSSMIEEFVEYLHDKAKSTVHHSKDFLFLEIFGTKYKMSISGYDDYEGLNSLIKQNFNVQNFPHLSIDIAVNISSENTVLFPTMNFFKQLKVKPNYFLFLNKNFPNVHEVSLTVKENKVINNSLIFEKYNFYSTLEDLLEFPRSYTSKPLISSEFIKSDLAGYSLVAPKTKLNNAKTKLGNCIDKLLREKPETWPYRVEVRIDPINIKDALTKVKLALKESKFLAYDSVSFLHKVYTASREMFIQIDNLIIKPLKPIYKSILIENFLINTFFKGSLNLQAITQRIHAFAREKIATDKRFSLPILDFDAAISNIKDEEMILTFEKMILYDFPLEEEDKSILRDVIHVIQLNMNEAAESVICRYIADMKRFYSLQDASNSFNALKSQFYPTDMIFSVQHLDVLLIEQFGASECQQFKKLPYKCMMALFLDHKNLPYNSFLDAIKSVILNNGIDLLYNMNKKLTVPKPILCKFKNISGQCVRTNMFNTEIREQDRNEIVHQIYSLIPVLPNSSAVKVRWTTDEKIRFFAGQRMHELLKNCQRKGIWSYLSNSSLYGFLLCRKENQLKDANVRFCKLPTEQLSIIKERGKAWHVDMFELNDIVRELNRFNINLSREAQLFLEQLHNMDVEDLQLQLQLVDESEAAPDLERINNRDVGNRTENRFRNSEPMLLEAIQEMLNETENKITERIIKYIDEREASRNDFTNQADANSYSFGGHDDYEPFGFSHEITEIKELEDKEILLLPAPKTIQSEPEIRVEDLKADISNELAIYKTLMNKYRYKAFNYNSSRANCFSSSIRPSKDKWNDNFLKLELLGGIQKTMIKNKSRLSVMLSDNTFLNQDKITNIISDLEAKTGKKQFSLAQIHESLNIEKQDKERLKTYLDDLVEDKALNDFVKKDGHRFYKKIE